LIKSRPSRPSSCPVSENGNFKDRRELVVGVDHDFFDAGLEEGLLGDVVAVVEDLADASADLGQCGWLRHDRWLFEFCFELGLAGAQLP